MWDCLSGNFLSACVGCDGYLSSFVLFFVIFEGNCDFSGNYLKI
jgi:hypothetical protein